MRSGELPASCTHQIKPRDGGHQCDGVCLHLMCLKEFRRRVSVCLWCVCEGTGLWRTTERENAGHPLFICVWNIYLSQWRGRMGLSVSSAQSRVSTSWRRSLDQSPVNNCWNFTFGNTDSPFDATLCVRVFVCELQCVFFASREKVKSFRTSTFKKKQKKRTDM